MSAKLCIFGDSISKGVLWDAETGRYSIARDSFVSLFAQYSGAEISSFAKFGCVIGKGAELLEKKKDKIAEFDRVLIEFGGNDCNFNWAEIAAAPDGLHRPATPPEEFAALCRRMVARVREYGSEPVLMNLPPIEPERFFAWLSRGLDAAAILRWLGDKAQTFRYHRFYSETVERVARETGTPLVDLRSAMSGLESLDGYICGDGMHPSEAGHRLIFESLKTCPALL